jgi:hypothetical protein
MRMFGVAKLARRAFSRVQAMAQPRSLQGCRRAGHEGLYREAFS